MRPVTCTESAPGLGFGSAPDLDLLGNLLDAFIETSPIATEVLDDPDHAGRQYVDALAKISGSC